MVGAARRNRSSVPDERQIRQAVSPARLAKRGTPRPKRGRGSDRRLGIQKLKAASLGVIPAMEWMTASILASKARKKEGRLASSSETQAR